MTSTTMENSHTGETMRHALAALLIVVCLEVGLLLLIIPWTGNWDRNYFLNRYPELRGWLLSPYVRGAVSGLGLLNLWLGTGEITHFRR